MLYLVLKLCSQSFNAQSKHYFQVLSNTHRIIESDMRSNWDHQYSGTWEHRPTSGTGSFLSGLVYLGHKLQSQSPNTQRKLHS